MPTGTVKKWVTEKDFGFVAPDDRSPDVFAPIRTFLGNHEMVKEGVRVYFEEKPDDKTGKPMAAMWRMSDTQPPPEITPAAAAPAAVVDAYSAEAYLAAAGYGGTETGYSAAVAAQYGEAAGYPGYAGYTAAGMGSYGAAPAAGTAGSRYSPYGAAKANNGLPLGWEQVPDPATGVPYFWNRTTNETSWTRPEGSQDPSGAASGDE
eukprot:CAMPEP_0176208266 /NCGR_PEP_ID=MMETSP0121_2-20121125/13032_1 /TAXON_ID=160619 /ORGANISM="Kryptoperidinium foliaceum, Strain CCMP 1326" /LENGTH=205 /DNA_ID=CAMNT_0017547247 /DNA_START=111 /DNA_END=728 /DNA_ORIENTATION=-